MPSHSMKKLRDTLLVVGGGIVCLIPAIYIMRAVGVITSIHTMLWILGGASVFLGGLLLLTVIDTAQALRFLGDGYKAVAIVTLNGLVLCAGLELAARSGFKIRSLMSSPDQQLVGEGSPREKVSYYSSQDWAQRYWYEFRLSRKQRYYPYVGWRRASFKGETINIDQNGIRLTPGADCSAKSFKVFAFGESSMWGTGSPDWGTIPANLQKGLEKMRQGPVCVVNFAESAYVLTQDIITLLMQLQSGNIPDVVLFYNVEGDAYAAYQGGRAGIIQNLDQVAARFEKGDKPPTLVDWLRRTSSYSLIDSLVDKLRIAKPKQEGPTPIQLVTYETMGINLKKLSDSMAENYFGDYRIVDALSAKHGFKYYFVLPPHLLLGGDKPLTLEEQQMKREAESDPAFEKLFRAFYQTLERESSRYQNIYSMVDVFDHYDSLIWIDAGHVTPTGNQVVARRILDIIQTRSTDKR
jgi:hypothetical protein